MFNLINMHENQFEQSTSLTNLTAISLFATINICVSMFLIKIHSGYVCVLNILC